MRALVRAELLVEHDRLILFSHEVEQVGKPEVILRLIVLLNGPAKLLNGRLPLGVRLRIHRRPVMRLRRLRVGNRFTGPDHRVEDVLAHHRSPEFFIKVLVTVSVTSRPDKFPIQQAGLTPPRAPSSAAERGAGASLSSRSRIDRHRPPSNRHDIVRP